MSDSVHLVRGESELHEPVERNDRQLFAELEEDEEDNDEVLESPNLVIKTEKSKKEDEEAFLDDPSNTRENTRKPERGPVNDDRPKKWTEVELLTIRLPKEEVENIPPYFLDSFIQPFYAFLYPFIGLYFVVTHGLYRFMICEGSCCLIFAFVFFPVVGILISVLSGVTFTIPVATIAIPFALPITIPTSLAVGPLLLSSLPILLWVSEFILNWLFAKGMRRCSYVEEHIMKGSRYTFALRCYAGIDTGKETGTWEKILGICVSLFFWIFRKLLRHVIIFIIFPVISAWLLAFFPPIGLIILVFITVYCLSLNFGFSSFESGFLDRKYETFLEMLGFAFVHHNIILGYGFGSLILYLIPGVNLAFYLWCSIGATRFMLHLDETTLILNEQE